MEYLNQRSILKVKSFEIIGKGLKIRDKSITKNIEFVVNYENITSRIKVFEFKKIIWRLLSFISFFVFLTPLYKGINKASILFALKLFPISLLLVLVFMFVYYYTIEKYIMVICTDGTGIAFFNNDKTEEQVRQFITILLEHRNDFMKNKYAKVDYDLPYENQVSIFKYLRDEKIITSEEYEQLKIKLKE